MRTDRIRAMLKSALGRVKRRRPPLSASFEDVEIAERTFYEEHLRDGMTVFDIGAAAGELSSLFARRVRPGRVHAFEPVRESHAALQLRVAAEGLDNVIVNQLAVADAARTVRLHCYEGAYRSWSSMALRPLSNYGIGIPASHAEDVAATTVDEYCAARGVEHIDLLKVDVEGAELQVLQGAAAMLQAKKVGCVSFEFGQTTYDMGNAPEAIEALLVGHGYTVRNLVAGDPPFPGRASVHTARFAMHLAFPR